MSVYIPYKFPAQHHQWSMAQYYLYITPVSSNTKYLLVNNSQNITREARARARPVLSNARASTFAQGTSPSCAKACMNFFWISENVIYISYYFSGYNYEIHIFISQNINLSTIDQLFLKINVLATVVNWNVYFRYKWYIFMVSLCLFNKFMIWPVF